MQHTSNGYCPPILPHPSMPNTWHQHCLPLQIIKLSLLSPELFQCVSIKPLKGVLLYSPPGTGKMLLTCVVATTLKTNFLKVLSSTIVDKINTISRCRFSEGTSMDHKI